MESNWVSAVDLEKYMREKLGISESKRIYYDEIPTYEDYLQRKLANNSFKNDPIIRDIFDKYLHINKAEYEKIIKFANKFKMIPSMCDNSITFDTEFTYNNEREKILVNFFEKIFDDFLERLSNVSNNMIVVTKGDVSTTVKFSLSLQRRSVMSDDVNLETLKSLGLVS
jgi:hypothetical protein